MLIRLRLPVLAAVAATLLPLTACSADGPHPVFAEPLAGQPRAAAQVTRDEGSVSFTQTMTYGSERGDVVQTTTGRLDFTNKRGTAQRSWRVPKGTPARVKDVLLGPAPLHGPARIEAGLAVDAQYVHYRPGTARYWLRYGGNPGDPLDGADEILSLRGRAAAIGGTLLEVTGGARATAQRHTPEGGRSYRTEAALSDAWHLFPAGVRAEMTQAWPASDAGTTPVRMTLTVDARGRITGADADLSALVGRKEEAFSGLTGLRVRLALTGHGFSEPAMPGPSETVLNPAEDVVSLHSTGVAPGGCVDFDAGAHMTGLVVRVDCEHPHDARVYAREPIGNLAYAPEADSDDMASDRCEQAYLAAPDRWTDDAVDDGLWALYAGEEDWGLPGASLTCYVLSR
ncbi:hypothetical protein [Streptomyces peucetius]|uniref:Septum formation-related domain-containing protein n=1 Tax=Streptomyces peucetius TaxID=1950 RepID=A0ABY6I408_STRPE|nr:hypothetical protein [Streptomyces peucetius]UYQ61711.1 hypothetical protein OGH68_09575 [Streptomyces peucetius]